MKLTHELLNSILIISLSFLAGIAFANSIFYVTIVTAIALTFILKEMHK